VAAEAVTNRLSERGFSSTGRVERDAMPASVTAE
jgi:hypothetical protein